MTDHDRIAELREQAFALTAHEQYRLAVFIAENVGYVLTGEPEHPDSPLRALAALPPAGWRDISTAPKDGTKVDLWITPVGISTGAGREPDCWWSVGRWWKYDEAFGDDQCRSQIWNATHWMPLPPAPQRTGE